MIFFVNGTKLESDDLNELIRLAFSMLGTIGNNNVIIPADIETVRTWALGEVKRQAALAGIMQDSAITDNPQYMIMINTEIVDFFMQGQPTNPNPVRYVISYERAVRKGVTLYEMLTSLLAKWLIIRDRVSVIAPELDRLTDDIETATTKLEIGQILATMDFS